MEYINVNGKEYQCNTTTSTNSISFELENEKIADVVEQFEGMTRVEVKGTDKETIGIYENIKFMSATVTAEKKVIVTMDLQNDVNARLDALETSQAEQDEAIAEIIGGDLNAE